jgi:hypothetical protein
VLAAAGPARAGSPLKGAPPPPRRRRFFGNAVYTDAEEARSLGGLAALAFARGGQPWRPRPAQTPPPAAAEPCAPEYV